MTTKKPASKSEKPTAPGRPLPRSVAEESAVPTPAGKVARVEEMLGAGLIGTSEQLAAVISTGRLECAVCGNGFAAEKCDACGNSRGQ